jgi:predicted small metal-binding protein
MIDKDGFIFGGAYSIFKFICKDLGLNCDYIVTGEHRVDVMRAAMIHTSTVHAEITKNFSIEQSWEYLKALEAAVQPE